MENYKNIETYLQAFFPIEMKKLSSQNKSAIQEAVENADATFEKKLAELMNKEQVTENGETPQETAQDGQPA